jgi:hypothetical protein
MFIFQSVWRQTVRALFSKTVKTIRRVRRCRLDIEALEDRCVPATFTVDTAVDANVIGSLR